MPSLFEAISATATCYHHMLMPRRLQSIKIALVEVFCWVSQSAAAVFTWTMVEY